MEAMPFELVVEAGAAVSDEGALEPQPIVKAAVAIAARSILMCPLSPSLDLTTLLLKAGERHVKHGLNGQNSTLIRSPPRTRRPCGVSIAVDSEKRRLLRAVHRAGRPAPRWGPSARGDAGRRPGYLGQSRGNQRSRAQLRPHHSSDHPAAQYHLHHSYRSGGYLRTGQVT